MIFLDRENSQEIELTRIPGCSYWENSSGEVYATDSILGYAWPVRPSLALRHVLLRQGIAQDAANEENVARVACCKQFDPGANHGHRNDRESPYKGHSENYLKNYKVGG